MQWLSDPDRMSMVTAGMLMGLEHLALYAVIEKNRIVDPVLCGSDAFSAYGLDHAFLFVQ